jgi:hypothetical protein
MDVERHTLSPRVRYTRQYVHLYAAIGEVRTQMVGMVGFACTEWRERCSDHEEFHALFLRFEQRSFPEEVA